MGLRTTSYGQQQGSGDWWRFDSIDAARELERPARKAAEDAARIGELIVPKGRHGQPAVNNWIAELMPIYQKITGKDPRASVIATGPRRGKATGPFIRFLEAASKPLEAEGEPLCVESFRERVCDIWTNARRQN